MRHVCHCPCHCAPDEAHEADEITAVSVTDPVEAAAACPLCRKAHCAALQSRRLANDPAREPSAPAPWVDPPEPKM
jgi:hypothetical protein